ncbi:hypothetical protein QSJ19_24560 [Gordonia sp. ABSL11-1]|nr:hypothetical protein [Gordonia sp. ABSL11-1]MDL9948699.1 hypothetical protein [Gordonia sp. ABSL11-1]
MLTAAAVTLAEAGSSFDDPTPIDNVAVNLLDAAAEFSHRG